jgi:hypothetical protein
LFRAIDELNPSVGLQQPGGGAKEGPNVEYPWRARDATGQETWIVPSEHSFGLAGKFTRSGDGATLVVFVRTLIERFDALFG